MKLPRVALPVLAAWSALLASGCGVELRHRLKGVRQLIADARESGAYVCAPRELAMAETHAEFTDDELLYGNELGATEEIEVAARFARLALDQSPRDRCAPQVTIVEKPAPPPAKIVLIEQLDTDGDGTTDDGDRCRELKGPRENAGCPWPDTDKDTVLDKDDRCPEVAGPVANQGCPWPDRDRDGLADKDDRCPDEAGPSENPGCPYKLIVVTKEKIELRQKVFFDTDKATIQPASFAMLGEIADLLVRNSAIEVRIEGHTDARASAAHNMKLSQARADSVRRFLIGRGVDPHRLLAIGYGPNRPIADNRTSVGREANRRVEFFIVRQ